MNLGRNDPCHCGSGKKYKKCHLDADQRDRLAVRSPTPSEQSQPDSESPPAFTDAGNLPELIRQLSEKGSAREQKKFAELLSETGPLLEYIKLQSDIETAAAELEAHQTEFVELTADSDRYLIRARAVFAEECFAPLRFTASDVQHAFDTVGYPSTMSPDEQTIKVLRAAILHVADKERRSNLAMSLLLHLPEFVAASRHLDAWILQDLAHQTSEYADESNPFLFEMFTHGYNAWAANKQAQNESMLRKMGIDPDRLRTMNLDELDAWIQAQQADASKTGMLEALFEDNPHLRDESNANLQALERNSSKLLEREDSRFLYLPYEEIQPWLKVFNERANQQGFIPDTPTKESVGRLFEEMALPLLREMADSIFTRERILQLVADLRKYRNERFAAGDQVTARHATGAINYLEREDSPGENSFLLTLCWSSVGSAIKAIGVETDNAAD